MLFTKTQSGQINVRTKAGLTSLAAFAASPANESNACDHRGPQTGTIPCQTCQATVLLKTFACLRHGDNCAIGPSREVRSCTRCPDKLPPGRNHPTLLPTDSVERALEVRRTEAPVNDWHRQPGFRPGWWHWRNIVAAEEQLARDVISCEIDYPGHIIADGIVICGGGPYLAAAWANVHVLRSHGVDLPIELWSLPGEIPAEWEHLFDGQSVTLRCPAGGDGFRWCSNRWAGWQLKSYAIAHSGFRRVVFLDADCYPYRPHSVQSLLDRLSSDTAVFHPDIEASAAMLCPSALALFGIDHMIPCESGAIAIDRERAWAAVRLALHYNSRADWTYQILWGDKDTFPIAWKNTGTPYAHPYGVAEPIPGVGIWQLDPQGRRNFLHLTNAKPTLASQEQFPFTMQLPGDLPHLTLCHTIKAALARLSREMARHGS